MHEVVDSVVEVMGGAYPELRDATPLVRRVIRTEEEAYAQTLGAGLQRLEQMLARASGETLSGQDVFSLSATYGLPFDDVQEIAAERGLQIDTAAYQVHVQRHREESRKGAKGTKFEEIAEPVRDLFKSQGRTAFLGNPQLDDAGRVAGEYPVAACSGLRVLAMFRDSDPVSRARTGDAVTILLDRTPFYAESGGQVGDTGSLRGASWVVQVLDTQKTSEDMVLHIGRVDSGEIAVGDELRAEIDLERRLAIMRNHTATHLLQGALKSVVGRHVTQQGSYVGPDYLRFDFTNPEALTPDQIATVEAQVNRQIVRNEPLTTRTMSMEDARKTGAIAPFGERYGATVRVVDVPGWDIEFCGGTHLPATGGIGSMIITGESAVASGVRRIEAVTGMGAVDATRALLVVARDLCTELSVPRDKMRDRVLELMEELRAQRKQIEEMRSKAATEGAGGLLDGAEEIGGVAVIVRRMDGLEAAQLREVFDQLKSRRQSGLAAVLASVHEGRVTLVAAATPDVVARGVAAGDVVKAAAALVGGSGGGRKDMAQAGGKDPSKVQEALDAALLIITKALQG